MPNQITFNSEVQQRHHPPTNEVAGQSAGAPRARRGKEKRMRKFLFSNSDTLPWGHNSRWKHGFYPNALRNGVENSVDDICQSENLYVSILA